MTNSELKLASAELQNDLLHRMRITYIEIALRRTSIFIKEQQPQKMISMYIWACEYSIRKKCEPILSVVMCGSFKVEGQQGSLLSPLPGTLLLLLSVLVCHIVIRRD